MTDTLSAATTATTIGGPGRVLGDAEVERFVHDQLRQVDLDGRSVCVLVPDGTRSCPLPLLMRAVQGALAGRAAGVTVLVALGTHAAMDDELLAAHLGFAPGRAQATYPGTTIVNHEWWRDETFADLGHISADRIEELSGGLLRQGVDVRLNRAVVEHDVALVVGPVFPHEVVGFSGGNKYFFPGVGGQAVIDISHWLGALITSAEIIGTRGITPVRALIDEAASLIPSQKLAFSAVVRSGTGELHALAFGDTQSSWQAAADVAAQTHVTYLDEPVPRVVSIMPRKYDDIWTAAKGFYKLEPVVADGGELVIYAPHITEISAMHPEINQIGYHCRDYFVKQWDRFSGYHWGVLAHSTHLRGAGTWHPESGEHDRVTVTLATGIPEHVVRAANLEYLHPDDVDVRALEADPGTFVVPNAGEVLYRLR